MKNVWLLVFFLSCKVLSGFAQNATFGSENESEKEVRQLEMRRFEMMVQKDIKSLSEILAEDLVYVHSNGMQENKAQLLETLDKGKTLYQSMQAQDIKARVMGEVVIINGTAAIRAWTGGKINDLQVRYIDVYAKRDGRWKLISWQSTRIMPPQ